MRVLQIIDSLESGGAERMAVNYANALGNTISFSGLAATRSEGTLKGEIGDKVNYIFVRKKHALDFAALLRLRKYCKINQVQLLHAHSSSYFFATILKCLSPRLKLVWHDHNGMSEFLNSREALILKFASIFFNGIIVVNNQLKTWASKELFCKEVIYIANFTQPAIDDIPITKLSGTAGKRILCLANLRPQKNHAMLLDVAVRLKATNPDWTFHLVGKDFNDEYSRTLHQSIIDRQLENYVFLYGSRKDINPIIDQCEIAILTSKSEGLPVALLEFGLCKKPVVVTAVGEIPLIIESGSNGFILMPNDDVGFYEAIVKLIDDNSLRIKLGDALFETIRKNNTSGTIMSIYLDWTKNLLQ